MNAMQAPPAVISEAARLKAGGVSAHRAKGHKHFKNVGYMGQEFKELPRWAVSKDALKKVIEY